MWIFISMYDNVFQPVQKLSEATRIYPGGLCDILFTPIENVLTWPIINPLTGGIDDDIELKPGATLYAAEFNNQTKEFNEEKKESTAGHFQDKLINATLPGNVTDNILALGTMDYHRFLVIFKDKNGEYRFFGNEDSGAKIMYKYTSGDYNSSRNRDIKIIWSHANPAPIYQGALTEISASIGGSLIMIASFKVKDVGTPMITDATTYDNVLLANKRPMVFQDGRLLPDLVNDIDTEQYVTKDLSGTEITWNNGGVNLDQIIRIFAY